MYNFPFVSISGNAPPAYDETTPVSAVKIQYAPASRLPSPPPSPRSSIPPTPTPTPTHIITDDYASTIRGDYQMASAAGTGGIAGFSIVPSRIVMPSKYQVL